MKISTPALQAGETRLDFVHSFSEAVGNASLGPLPGWIVVLMLASGAMMFVVWFVPRIDTEKIVSSARWMMATAFVCTNVFEVQRRFVTLIIPVIVIGMVPPRNVSAVLLLVSLVASHVTKRMALIGFCGKNTSAVFVEVVALRVT